MVGTHKKSISEWTQCRILLEIIFGEYISYTSRKYTGLTHLVEHIEHCRMTWLEYVRQEWVHHFIHTLDMKPRNSYTSVEIQRGNIGWEELSTSFTHTFKFADDHPTIDVALQVMKEKIFEEILVSTTNFH